VRRSADGHRIAFGLARPPDHLRPRLFGWATLALLLALTALAYAYVRRLLGPLRDISAGVEAYGRGEFGSPIAVRRTDELGALAGRVNGMATNLHGMLEAKRALLLAISHELRSPLTRARVNAELLDDSAPRQALLDDLGAMRDLITQLLESERLAQGHSALQAEACDLAALARDLLQTQFEGRGVALGLDDTMAPVTADPTRMRLLLRNLVDNALRYSPDGAEVRVAVARADGQVQVQVDDSGPGLAKAELARLGERFFRVLGTGQSGSGLGWSIVRRIAAAHGARVAVGPSAALEGLAVTVGWPVGD